MASKNSRELKNIFNRITGKPTSDDNTVINFIEVMKIVGGYDQLLNLPISAFNVILKGLIRKQELEEAYVKKHGKVR